jgi:hypothetical protein
VTDRPRLVGWSSLHQARHRSLTLLVVIAGTPRRFQNRREAGSTCTFRCSPCVDPGDLDRHHAAPCGANMSNDRNAFRRVAIDRVTPAADAASAFCLECAARPRAPFSRRSHRLVRQHSCGNLLGQRRVVDLPCGSSSSATRDASNRLLPSHVSVRVPAPRWFPLRRSACALRAIGEIACPTSVRFASVGRTYCVCHRGGRSCSRRDACGPDL